MKKLIGVFVLISLLGFAPAAVEAQCPMCRAAVTSASDYGAKENKLAAGLNAGILYMFALPYCAMMMIGVVLVVNYRRNRMRNGQELSETTVADVIGDHHLGSRTNDA